MPKRLFDTIILGDHNTANSWEIFEESKITRVINCAARESTMCFENAGIEYVIYLFFNQIETYFFIDI